MKTPACSCHFLLTGTGCCHPSRVLPCLMPILKHCLERAGYLTKGSRSLTGDYFIQWKASVNVMEETGRKLFIQELDYRQQCCY